jgi:PEGA domain
MRHVLAAVLCIALPIAMFASGKNEISSRQSAGAAAQDNGPKTNQSPADADKARVFITDSESWSIAGASGGANGAYGGSMAGGARPQTAEIVKTFGERCPQVVTNNKQDRADYIVVLDHEGGKGVLRHKNKVAVFNRTTGDSIVSKSTLSLGGSVEDACKAITADWAAHSTNIRAAESAAVAVSEPRPAASPVPAAAALAQLQVTSTPDGADIEIDGSFVGNTPSAVGVAPGQHQLSVKKAGFKPWEKKIAVSSGQVHVSAVLEPAQ